MMSVVSVVTSVLLSLGLFVLEPQYRALRMSMGPYSIIFACLVFFFFDVPATYRFRVCGLSTSDKLFTYILALQVITTFNIWIIIDKHQLLFANSPNSVVAGLCGIVSGLLYRSETLRLNKLQFPQFVNNFCCKFILPWIQSAPRTQRAHPVITPQSIGVRYPVSSNSTMLQVILFSILFNGCHCFLYSSFFLPINHFNDILDWLRIRIMIPILMECHMQWCLH